MRTCSFFDRKAASETPWTRELWIYDSRTNQYFTFKQNPFAAGTAGPVCGRIALESKGVVTE
jgi:N-acetylneuraminic acid mutarotase